MTRLARNINGFLLGVLLIVGFARCAEAGGTDIEQEVKVINGDTLVSGSDSIGIGFGMGDVDIAQCMYTKGTPVFQWGKYNRWCMADSLDSRGLHTAASKLRCNIKEYREIFESETECLKLSLMEVFHVEPMAEPIKKDDEDNHLEAVYARISDLEADRMAQAKRAEKAAKRANAAAQKAETFDMERKEQAQASLEALSEYRK